MLREFANSGKGSSLPVTDGFLHRSAPDVLPNSIAILGKLHIAKLRVLDFHQHIASRNLVRSRGLRNGGNPTERHRGRSPCCVDLLPDRPADQLRVRLTNPPAA